MWLMEKGECGKVDVEGGKGTVDPRKRLHK